MKLISATPSPYARKVRIALAEKGIPFDLETEVPSHGTSVTPQYNPPEKLPVLILEEGSAVYASHYVLEWTEARPEVWLLSRQRTESMAQRPKPEEIVSKLRQVDVLVAHGQSVAASTRAMGVTEVTYDRSRRAVQRLEYDQAN
ncbi:glutathione S-transferase N-terminal domain-containing protein, partial [Methylobacterium sp. J-048]|uniref:glutathione S-transferase N-terminal domain-containing protein n=1 Tax=Methylobacterium sp. J-048 TaxID=2836635 RepID=UPI001FBB3A86